METKLDKKCIILARGSSKRVLNKNLQLINNKSLVEYAIECCIQSGIDTILSSDSEDILKYGKNNHYYDNNQKCGKKYWWTIRRIHIF